MEGALQSEFGEKFRNFTGILQDKFPNVDLSDIPGLDAGGDGTPTTRSSNFTIFMCSLIFGMFWITYITLFNARVVGSIISKITNKFVSEGYFKVGSLSWAIMPGKIMFRDVAYVTPDYTIRVQDGFLVFRWWRSYVPKDVSEDLSHSDTRLSLQLNGFECHCYNRSSVYRSLEKKFGLEPRLYGDKDDVSDEEDEIDPLADDEERPLGTSADKTDAVDSSKSSSFLLGQNWRDLIPVIKIDMATGKLVFGNKLLPTTLVIYFEEARLTYSTKPAACSLDHFMHFIKCKAENFKVLLSSSPKYTGMRDEAPRFMGEGFVVAASNEIDVYYYMDEAGVIPPNDQNSDESTSVPVPEWGVDIKCGKATNFSYGPWADRQREMIYKFFFPPDYQNLKPTPTPKAGEMRQANIFRIRLSTQHESTLDILFSKLKETKAVHMTMGQGTNFEVKIPWRVEVGGYTSNISGTLMMAEATTSLAYREMLKCETLQIQVEMNYPLSWNAHQEWLFGFIGTKATLNFIFAHKFFFQDLIDDWSVRSPPDLLYFVPYTWKFHFALKEFEFLTLANEFNWIDTSSTHQENCLLAICGETLHIKFGLPYTEFLPPTVLFVFDIEGFNLDLSIFLPETNTSHDILYSLDLNAKIATRDGRWRWKRDDVTKKWRRNCLPADGWVDCWSAPKVTLAIEFLFHPIPMAGPLPQADVPTPEKEKHLLSPLRAPSVAFVKSATRSSLAALISNFEPDKLEPDRCKVELKMEASTAYLYGSLIRSFMHVKENMFGEDQHFTPMDVSSDKGLSEAYRMSAHSHDLSGGHSEDFDPRHYRPLEVQLDLALFDVQANLLKNCSPEDPPCPFLVVEKIMFEMDKRYRETLLQLQLTPVILRSGISTLDRKKSDDLSQGHLLLTGLQFRGHAMFSEIERPLGSETLEYAWLIEIQCGSLFGKITAAQLYDVFISLETFLFLSVDKENVLKHPRPFKVCQHNENQKECNLSDKDEELCPTVEELKYRLVRFSADAVDVCVVEKASSMRVQACPLRFSMCNLHGPQTKQGVTALVNSVLLQQYVNSNFPLSRSDLESHHHPDIWIESGAVHFGPVYIEGSLSGHNNTRQNVQHSQHVFLQKHDRKTHRLWFLWPPAITKVPPEVAGKCGCVGGCSFFGANCNGRNFFKPSRGDIDDRCNVAIPTIKDRKERPAYGQSILYDNVLVTSDCKWFRAFCVLGEQLLPPQWPYTCRKPSKLPFCPDFRTHKSSSSNTSGETPKHPKHHRSFSRKRGRTPSTDASRLRSVSACGAETSGNRRRSGENQPLILNRSLSVEAEEEEETVERMMAGPGIPKASSLVEVQSDLKSEKSGRGMARAESLVSDVLSFYSFDGNDTTMTGYDATMAGSRPSLVSSRSKSKSYNSPQNERYSSPMSPVSNSTQYYETASQGVSSICSASFYETASQGRTSSLSYDTATLQPESPPNLNALEEDLAGEEGSATLSHSLSTHSFMSAMSDHEDFGLVNLHMQVNKPITESPLLMSSYISHLTQLRCSNWATNLPVLPGEETSSSKSVSAEHTFPYFEMLEEGFSCIRMEGKSDLSDDSKNVRLTPRQTHGFDWDMIDSAANNTTTTNGASKSRNDEDDAEDSVLFPGGNTSKTTIIVKFKGSIDVILSPIFLESVQRIFDALTPTFQTQHPVSVVNHLHSGSLDRVESKNTLKKEKSLDLQEKLVEIHEPSKGKSGSAFKETTEMLRTFEKSISSFVQASLHLPMVNLMVLQASVVEEMCAFSALDNVRDITCVSLLALGIQETTFQFCKKSQSKKTVQMYFQRPRASYGKKKKSKYKIAFDTRQDEPFTFESSETQKEEVLMTGSLQKMHAQLRRLRNDSSILKDAYITAIPNHKSKVFFNYVDVPKLSSFRSSTPVEDDPNNLLLDSNVLKMRSEESKLGFNMCECGFEGINIKVAKRSSNQIEEDTIEEQEEASVVEQDETCSRASPQQQQQQQQQQPPPPRRGEEYDRSKIRDETPANATTTGDKITDDECEEANYSRESVAGAGGKHSTASGSVELRTSWFNFAAPPKTPISRKIDFTRLDWNLLSTASPSIDAWLGPIDRLQNTASQCLGVYHQRVASVMASLMAEALDVASDNFLKLTKYDKLTALSRTLRDDPSCQLCSILVKYALKMDAKDIENNLKGVPPLTTLRQGIVVLSRQWKNALYTPILIEYNLRSRGLKNLYSAQIEPLCSKLQEEDANDEDGEEGGDVEEDNEDDEDTLLDLDLDEEAALLLRNPSFPLITSQNEDSIISDIPRLSPLHFTPRSAEEKSRIFDVINKRNSVVDSIESNIDQVHSFSGEPPVDGAGSGGSPSQNKKEENLYDWMRRLQAQGSTGRVKGSKQASSKDNVAINIESGEDDERLEATVPMEPPSTPQATKSLHLLDAHIIFEPLLSSLGLMPQQIQNLSLKNLGSNVSVLANIAEFRIDIVESEFGKMHRSRRNNKTGRRLLIDTDTSPEFLCEKVYVQLDFKKVTDIKASGEKVLPLYISRAQLKRHTSSHVNFSIDIYCISQKVNMPLLRLLNQIVTMHQNVKETNEELKEKKPEGKKSYMTHKKSPSGSSTSSNLSVQLRRSSGAATDLQVAPSILGYAESNKLSDSSSRKTILQTPSPSVTLKSHLRSRPKSFAQKFRPNSRLAGMGYTHTESPGGVTDHQDSFVLTSAPLERITEEQTTVHCWKTMYNLLELYSTMPTTKTVQRHSLTPLTSSSMLDAGILLRAGRKNTLFAGNNRESGGTMKTPDTELSVHEMTPQTGTASRKVTSSNLTTTKGVSFAKADVMAGRHEHTPVVVFGIAKIRRTKLMATLSGLKLEGEIRGLQSSLHYKEKIRAPTKGVVEASVMGNMQEANIVLREGIPPGQQTVVKVTIGKTNLLHGSHMWKTKDKNSGTMHVELIQVDIPQHPVDLHSIVTRGTKELSSTLQEFRGVRILQRGNKASTVAEDQTDRGDAPHGGRSSPMFHVPPEQQLPRSPVEDSKLIKPLVMQFHLTLKKFTISAALLPSLQAEYCMERVTSRGVTGSKAKFVIDLPKHSLSFATKIQENFDNLETNLPSEASIDLPKVHVSAEYIQDESRGAASAVAPDGSIISQGSYLSAEAEIGNLEHCLTTDLLNHLVFVQKVFMKEVNEVVQKMSGSDRPVPVWSEFGEEIEEQQAANKQLLFSVSVRLKNITIMATTPANSGVRFETGVSELQFSNRVENIVGSIDGKQNKISTKAHINMKLSLGQIIRDPVYYEAETQFQTQAYFKTSIQLRNAFQGETGPNEKDVIYITLDRPLVFLQPVAVDRAILFWLSYKNAWEYWTEQRLNLNKEVLIATEQVLEKVPLTQITSQLSAQHVGTLFLQLDVRDIGVCVPLSSPSTDPWSNSMLRQEFDTLGAIVATVESSSISACSAGSMVSMGKFQKLCLRFAEDFNHTLDDWKPDPADPNIMNLCLVSEGSYEICSQTAKAVKEENAKWFLNIQWQMTGVDVHADSNIGKHLSSLARTLTALTGEEEDDQQEAGDSQSISEEDDSELSTYASEEPPAPVPSQSHPMLRRQKTQQVDLDLPPFLFEPSLEKSVVAKYLEQEINEQAKVVEDLQKLGASDHIVSSEIRKLQELQNIASKNFRQDLAQKLRRQKSKASYFKEKFGLGTGGGSSNSSRLAKSKSIALPSPTKERVEFGKLKRIRSGEVLTGSPERETDSEPKLDRSFDLGAGDVTDHTLNEVTSRHVTDVTARQTNDVPVRHGDVVPLFDQADYEDSPHFPRDKTKFNVSPTKAQPGSGGGSINHSASLKVGPGATEPNVDFEFHVKISVNSGKCVLHTAAKDDEKRRMKKDRSFSGNFFDNSPNVSRKFRSGGGAGPPGTGENRERSSTRLRAPTAQDMTIFYIPGLDARVHYNSRTETEETYSFDPNKDGSCWVATSKRPGGKKATLCAWMTLQSIPQETIITPNILQFLEQALEPIPTLGAREQARVNEELNMYEDSSSGSHNGHVATSVGSSFPVDVIVYFHMQSSTFRFSCVPVSRVECMLRLPSLDVVFSSKKADGEIHDEFASTLKNNNPGQSGPTPTFSAQSSGDASDDDRSRSSRAETVDDAVHIGGLSITGCLNDFSLHVFHPYGGGRKNKPEEMFFSPLSSEERKDSLRVNVAFVKFHISRSRRVSTEKSLPEKKGSAGNEVGTACVRFSTIIDIGSASFEYDMRRLSETLAFPKAWYRRALVRRLFLGELKTTSYPSENDPIPQDPGMGVKVGTGVGAPPRRGSVIPPNPRDRRSSVVVPPVPSVHPDKKTWVGRTSAHSWETLVVFAVSFKELKVLMNMGNVMGNVEWLSKDIRSEGRFSIGSSGHKNMYVGLGLNGLKLEAKAGIVGGSIDLGRIDAYCHLREDSRTDPFHEIGLKLDVIEVRFDYMSTSVLMGRVSHLVVRMKDDWHVTDVKDSSTMKPAQIFVQGDLSWDQFQMLISKSTTADLLKILNKLEEFFSQQFKSSKKLFSSLEPGPTRKSGVATAVGNFSAASASTSKGTSAPDEVGHHRHWQSALSKIAGMKIYTLPFKLPDVGSVLGGVLELRGRHISLACFHGINFKSKSWALFSLKDPSISFVSDAQEIMEDKPEHLTTRTTTVIQTLSFSLGQSDQPTRTHHDYMATVKKVSRGVNYLPPMKSLSDWFQYAFKSSDMDEVQRFPTLSPSNEKEREIAKSQQRPEEIFALPCLRMDLKTKHVQGEQKPGKDDPKPVVDCTFVTDFDNHIFVTTDAEAFFFLHDLISSYVKEKQRVLNIQQQQNISINPSSNDTAESKAALAGLAENGAAVGLTASDDKTEAKDSASGKSSASKIDPLQNDWRDFECHTWHLEPTVRLISWAGSQIEPYGVDYILQRLGFNHARTTIPKWLQRGCMDPLDKILSVIVLKTIQVVQEEKASLKN